MENTTGRGWLRGEAVARAYEESYRRMRAMSLDDLEALRARDPELAEHYEESFPDLISLKKAQEVLGFGTLEETEAFLEEVVSE